MRLGLWGHKTRVLVVCRENICRSPLAAGLLRHHLRLAGLTRVSVASVGTRVSQPGHPIDPRARRVAAASGIRLGRRGARRMTTKDIRTSDYVLVMDQSNLADLESLCPPEHRYKISLLLSPLSGPHEVPDPYYRSYPMFEEVFLLIERGVLAWVGRFAGEFDEGKA